MLPYQVIAKKFRPKKFSEVFGQETIVQTLKNAIRFERIGHAYLFCGTRGTGKTTLARLFAKAINCESLSSENEPCDICPSCREIRDGHSLDVIEIDGASNRGIDDIRNLNETVGYASSNGKYKIYIIDEVHMLTKEAFNALLKTLEQPPSHVIFFFATTEPHKVLPTILSRCQRFDLNRITPEKIKIKLKNIVKTLAIEVEEEALDLIAAHAEGSLRDGESLLDQLLCYEEPPITKDHAASALGLVNASLFFQLDQAVYKHGLASAFSISDTIFKAGYHLQHFLESLAEHYRIIAKTQMGYKSPNPEYEKAAKVYSKHHTLDILDYLIEALEKGQKTTFKQIHLEITLLHIIRGSKKIPIESLVERLENLKKAPPAPVDPPPSARPVEEVTSKREPKETSVPKKEPTTSTLPVEEVAPQREPKETPAPQKEPTPLPPIQQKIKHEQVMRFAAVELSGVLRK